MGKKFKFLNNENKNQGMQETAARQLARTEGSGKMPGRQLSRGAPCAVQVAAETCLPGQLRDRPCAEGGAAQAKRPGPRRKSQMQNPQIQRANRETLKELNNKQDDAPNTLPPRYLFAQATKAGSSRSILFPRGMKRTLIFFVFRF